MKAVEGFWSKTGACVQTVGEVGSILLLGLRWRTLVAPSMDRRPPPSIPLRTFQSRRWFFTRGIWDGSRLQASSGRASPTMCPTLGLVFRQLVTARLHPKCSKKWGCREVRAHFLFHLSTCEIDFSHVGFKVEGRVFKSTFLPLHVQGGKTPDGGRLGDRSTCRYVKLCLWKDNCWNKQFWIVNLI